MIQTLQIKGLNMFKNLITSFFSSVDNPNLLKNGDFFKTRLIIEDFNKTIEETYFVNKAFDMDNILKEFSLNKPYKDDQLVLFYLKDHNYIQLVKHSIPNLKNVPVFVLIVESTNQ